MKKLLLTLFVLVLSAFSLCACNQNEIDETSFSSTDASQTEQTSEAEETTKMEQTSETEETFETESSSETEQTEPPVLLPQSFVSPVDEIKVTKTVSGVNIYGMRMNIFVQGYASESLGMDFYLKSNEENAFEFTLTNGTDEDIWQFAPDLTHRFWFDVAESEQGGQLIDLYYTDMMGFAHVLSFNKIAVGEVKTQSVRLWSADWQNAEENVCVRSGVIVFPYQLTDVYIGGNTHSVSIDFSYTEVFVSDD